MSPSFSPLCPHDRGGDSPELDLVLMLDRSASMAGRLRLLGQGLRQLLDRLPRDGVRVGLVTFGPTVSVIPLTEDRPRLLRGLSRLHPQGGTHYDQAFRAAAGLFNEGSLRRQVVLLCTDGETDCGADTPQAVHALRRLGVEVFSVGLAASAPLLAEWSGSPTETHVLTAHCPEELPQLLLEAGGRIFGEALAPVCPPPCPPPPVPPAPICPEPCPQTGCGSCCCLPACKTCGVVQLPPADLTQQGRMLYLTVTLKDVCPDRRIALAVFLTETTPQGEESRGMRCFTVPAQTGKGCRDVTVKCIPFPLPEDLCGCDCCGCHRSLCRDRCFHARVIANYLETDTILCCGVSAQL